MSINIENFEELIKPKLGNGEKFVSYKCENLLGTGENYGSVMLSIEIKILSEDKEKKIVNCVGKTCPPSEFLWNLFNTKVTFKKEIGLYKMIVPAINNFGKERGLDNIFDFFAECLGARVSLDPQSDEVDKNAILLLENLKLAGYEMCDRFVGFDMDCAKLLLKDLAVMHAATIAFKLARPEEFKTLLPLLNNDYEMYFKDDVIDDYIKSLQEPFEDNPYVAKIDKAVRDMKYFVDNPPKGKEIFTTLIHNDYWTNNTLVKFKNGKPIKNKMVDFQIIEHGSLAHDVVFFIYSSVEMEVLENHVDELIRFYYDQFFQTLVSLKCDITPYTFEGMLEEFALITRDFQFSHLLYMLPNTHKLKGKAKDLAEFTIRDIILNRNLVHKNYFRRMEFILTDLGKKGWI